MAQNTILILAEEQEDHEFLTAALENHYETVSAETEREALAVLKASPGKFSMALLSLLPQENAFSFLDVLQAEPACASIPVIIAAKDRTWEEAAFEHGASDFLLMPCGPQAVRCRVTNLLRLKGKMGMPGGYQFDWLTGLYSKECFYRCANETLQKNPGKKYDIVCSDFENFKLVNEIYGRQTGDRLLCGTADLLMKALRGEGLCSHFSSDWFVCMMEHRESYSDTLFKYITERVNEVTEAKNISIKWGIYVTEKREVSIEEMCDWALETARSIKGQYGKYFAYYDDELRNRMLREQEITACMEQALNERQFHVWLQPKYRLDGSRVCDAEALVRWFHPTWGTLLPGKFIPLFEKNGFITNLDLYVWEEVCRMLRKWEENGIHFLRISVNISRADFYKLDLCEVLPSLTDRYGISRDRLHLEVTESVVAENLSYIAKTARELRKKGFVIEMDDFGSGYSSLNMLNQLPMDILKLDMQFIRSEMDKPERQGILRYIIGLAHWLNLDVVAEGVESYRQMERLKDLDCDYVQGYYMAKPMSPEAFQKLLENQNDRESEAGQTCVPVIKKKTENGILFVICEEDCARSYIRSLFEDSFEVKEAQNEDSMLAGLGRFGNHIQVILLSAALAKQNQSSIWNMLLKEKRVWDTPVILFGEANADEEELALEMGADDFEGIPCRQESLRIRVKNVLGKKESLRRQLLNDSLPGAMMGCYWESGLPVYFINGMMLDLLGYDSDTDFINNTDGLMTNAIHPEDGPAMNESMDLQLSASLQYSLEYRIRKKDGSYIWVQGIGRLVKAENGRDVLISVFIDNTAEKVHQAQEREQYAREIAFFSEIAYPGGIRGKINLTRDLMEQYFHTTEVCISYDGDTFSHFAKKLADSAAGPGYRKKLLSELNREKMLNAFRDGKREYHFEFLRKTNNERLFWACMDFRLYLNPDTLDVAMFFYTQNITDKKIRDFAFQFVTKMDYDLICDVDMMDGTYRMLSYRSEGTNIPKTGIFQAGIRQTVCSWMDERTRRSYLAFMDFENIRKHLENQGIYSFIINMADKEGNLRTKKYQIFYTSKPLLRVGITRTDVTDVVEEDMIQV
ncbi:MAG: EAL domain-containing protein [Lachnospiraceae bacterium]|nr:EAL domain-containing protein [Lachnospiraceae bacterium]